MRISDWSSDVCSSDLFGTLESLYPGRIDLGLGRAPGTDMRTARALRRDMADAGDSFPRDVVELQAYFKPAIPDQAVRAVPGAGLAIPIWLLGSSTLSGPLAALLGLTFSLASHFAPAMQPPAVRIPRYRFAQHEAHGEPHR